MPAGRLLALAACLAFAAPALAAPSQLHLGWQGPTDTTMTVTWRSTEPSGSVEYGTGPDLGLVQQASSSAYGGSYLHEAQLTGLAPGTPYRYRCGSGSSWSPVRTFTTGPEKAAATSFRFAAFGDSRSDDAARRRVRAAVESRAPAFSIDTGDLVDDGTLQPLWDGWFAAMEPLIATTPLMPALGNHEMNSALYFRQFAMGRHEPSTPGYEDEAFYSFDYGNVHFVALSSEHSYGSSSAQYAWLEADLQRAAADPAIRWTVAFFHRPPYSSGAHGSELGVRAAWGPLFEKYGVDVVFSGHDHDYERTTPQGGVLYLVSGGAGAPLRAVGTSGFTAVSRSVLHFVELDVTADELSIEARDPDGNVFDAVTLTNASPLPIPGGDAGGGGGGGAGGGAGPGQPPAMGGCSAGAGTLLSLAALAVLAARRRRR